MNSTKINIENSVEYKYIIQDKLKEYFNIKSKGEYAELRYRRGINRLLIKLPFKLDEDIASLAGLMPDGSLIKDLMRVYFGQKKDLSKIYLFKNTLINKFGLKNKVFIRKGCGVMEAYTNSQTLARFLYHILNFSKSDEQMRIPSWVFESPESVKIAYLREAFAMEGTILKSLREIRFISKDKDFALDIQKLLSHLDMTSTVNKRIGGTPPTTQYRLSIYRKDNFKKFKKIGFSLDFHKERFNKLLEKNNIK
jgi:intein/homing endonuclease